MTEEKVAFENCLGTYIELSLAHITKEDARTLDGMIEDGPISVRDRPGFNGGEDNGFEIPIYSMEVAPEIWKKHLPKSGLSKPLKKLLTTLRDKKIELLILSNWGSVCEDFPVFDW